VLAGIAAAVVLVVCPQAVQPQTAETVLVETAVTLIWSVSVARGRSVCA
jgi:hypothetical protein